MGAWLPVSALAASDFEAGGVCYSPLSGQPGEAEVIKNQFDPFGGYAGSVTIPAEVRDALGNTYRVTGIASQAFKGSEGLTAVSLPASLERIGAAAFSGCTALSAVALPAGVTEVGGAAFQGCTGLQSVSLPASLADIGMEAFAECTALPSVVLPEALATVDYNTFEGCTALQSVVFPAGVTAIEGEAFKGCTSLSALNLPTALETIGSDAFNGCEALAEVTVPTGVTYIGSNAFGGCKGLRTLDYRAADCRLGYPVGWTAITQLRVGEGVERIPDNAFSGCSALAGTLSLPEGVTHIGEFAFGFCDGLTAIELPPSLASIGYGAFDFCEDVAEITVLATLPPVIDPTSFEGIDAAVPVYVPAEALANYRAAEVWGEMNLQPIGGITGLERLSAGAVLVRGLDIATTDGSPLCVYDVNGRRIARSDEGCVSVPRPGVYVAVTDKDSETILITKQ